MMKPKPHLSAILVCQPDDPELPDTIRQYARSLAALPDRAELIVVGGQSCLNAAGVRPALAECPVPVVVLDMPACHDESMPITAAVKACSGGVIALLPGYIQTDPAELAGMVERVRGGADYVASWRYDRVDSRWSRGMSAAFNRLTRRLTGVPLHDLNSGLRVMKREVLEQTPIYGDQHRFLPVLALAQGFRVEEVRTRHLRERVRKGDYSFGVYLRRLLDLLTLFFLIKFTRKPLRFFGLLGSGMFALGAVTVAGLVVQRLLGVPLADRPLLLLGLTLAVLGTQLFSIGLLGELLLFVHGHKMRNYRTKAVYKTPDLQPQMNNNKAFDRKPLLEPTGLIRGDQ